MLDRCQRARLSRARRARSALAFTTLMALGAGGCASGIDDGRTDPESERMHLGRVHVLLEPAEDDTAEGAPGSFEVTARFAWVRGIDEDLARTRIDMPVLPHEILRPGECTPTDQLGASAELDPESSEVPELVLLDAGDLVVGVGDDRVRVPLSLVPDLLPYMSGVEYLQEAEMVPVAADAVPSVSIRALGSQTDDLPPFVVDGRVPPALGLEVSEAELDGRFDGALVIRWRDASAEPVTVRVLPLLGGEPVGEEITCVIADNGQGRIDLARLHTLGLPAQADAVRLTASRIAVTAFDVGEFIGSELVIERRDRLYVPLR